jgi:hypothetical protein
MFAYARSGNVARVVCLQISTLVSAQQMDVLSQNFPFITPYYNTCLDTAAIDAAGWKPSLGPWLMQVADAQSDTELFHVLGMMQLAGLVPGAIISVQLQTEAHYAQCVPRCVCMCCEVCSCTGFVLSAYLAAVRACGVACCGVCFTG